MKKIVKRNSKILMLFFTICLALYSYAGISAAGTSVRDKQPEKPAIMYIVDGKVVEAKEVDKLDQEDIEKMEFIQEPEKIKKYTDKDVDTVVLITMKKEAEETEPEGK